MSRNKNIGLIGPIGLILFVAGCAHYPLNARLGRYDVQSGYRFQEFKADATNSNSLLVCLAFSGGGTRAAALSYGVLKKLAALEIQWEGKKQRLLDEVDCISSVSGGSFTAAYYALFGDRLFTAFPDRFLYRDIQGEILGRLWNPVNWFRLLSPHFSRIDLAAELYHTSVFEQKTFRDLLAARRRPFLMINATNLGLGRRFEFTQDQFDAIGSDLADYPIARAVASSSAFPFLLSPVSLKNHPQPSDYKTPSEYLNALKDYERNRRRYEWAKNLVAYEDKANRPFVHLMDGGLADNLGLRAIEESFRRGHIRDLINNGEIQVLMVIVVNARTDPPSDIEQREAPPDLKTVAYKVATTSMDNYAFETVETTKELHQARVQAQRAITDCQDILKKECPGARPIPRLAGELEPYVIEINFEGLTDNADRRNYFLSLPTSFGLSHQQVDELIAVGQELLARSPEFQRFMSDLSSRQR